MLLFRIILNPKHCTKTMLTQHLIHLAKHKIIHLVAAKRNLENPSKEKLLPLVHHRTILFKTGLGGGHVNLPAWMAIICYLKMMKGEAFLLIHLRISVRQLLILKMNRLSYRLLTKFHMVTKVIPIFIIEKTKSKWPEI